MTHRPGSGAAVFRRALGAVSLLLLSAQPVAALDLALPEGATIVAAIPPAPGSHRLATGTWDGTRLSGIDVAGTVRSSTWQIPAADGISVASVAAGLERQLRDQGYGIDLSCADTTCGGFDFRQRLDMGRSPEMHVDIGNFRYLAASGATEDEAVAVTVSAGGQTLYVHVVHVGDTAADAAWATPSSRALPAGDGPADAAPASVPDAVPPSDAIARLTEFGAVALDDLRFRTGASDLSGTDYRSLEAIASFLGQNPDRRVMLVGHTDAQGGRESNIALSEARAEAVRRHLIDALGVNPAQLEAAGIGFLAPRATNETADGREANRRVEVVLLEGG